MMAPLRRLPRHRGARCMRSIRSTLSMNASGWASMIAGCCRTELFGIRTDGVGRIEKVRVVDPPPGPATHEADLIRSRFDAVTDGGAELAKDIDSAIDGTADIHRCLDEVGVHGVIHGSSLHPAAEAR